MTRKSIALAAALLATSTLTTVANAGGMRVGLTMGGPLGNFTAHEYQSDTGRSYARSYAAKPGCHKPAAVARSAPRNYDPPVRHVKRSAPKVEVAEAPVRKIKRVAPKVEVAEAPAPRPRKIAKVVKDVVEAPVIKTAKLEDTTTITDAAPSIYVPETPPAAVESNIKGTQSTPAARTATVTVEPDPAATAAAAATAEPVKVELKTEPVKVEAAKVEEPKVAKTAEVKAPETKAKAEPSTAKRLCRRFSAAIAGLIDVPCE